MINTHMSSKALFPDLGEEGLGSRLGRAQPHTLLGSVAPKAFRYLKSFPPPPYEILRCFHLPSGSRITSMHPLSKSLVLAGQQEAARQTGHIWEVAHSEGNTRVSEL